jgi:acyl carrier protein
MTKNIKVEAGPNDRVVDLYKDDKLKDIRYGRWNDKPRGDGRYLLPAYLGGSDYSGSIVERSNFKAFQEKFGDGEDEWWTNAIGSHGTFALLIDMQGVPEDIEEEVAEFLNALHDYPVADDDLHSQMEMEAQNEAWDSWAKKDFIKALEKKFDVELDDVDDEKIFELFHEACDSSNTYWENQQGDEMYIDLDRVVKKIKETDLVLHSIIERRDV